MDKFLQLLTLLLQEAKDPAALLKRVLTIFVAVILYLAINHTTEVASFLKAFSTSAILEDQKIQRVNNFPAVAREKAMMLYSQTRSDAVFVVKYKPDAINDYQNIIVMEGALQLDKEDMADKAVDKTSDLYRKQLEGFNYVVKDTVKQVSRYSGKAIPPFKNVTYKYVYTCPYFNLNNVYAGYIGIAWKEPPVAVEDEPELNDYLAKLCDPQRRALGRSI